MPVNYTSSELQLSGTVTNAEFYNATSTAGLSKDSHQMYQLDANVRVLSGADVSGLKNIIISLNTRDFYIEDTNCIFNEITFIEYGGRTVADRVVFKTANGGETPIFNNCQFIHNITGNPGGADPRYLTMVHMQGGSNFVMRASDFSEQEIDGTQFMKSGIYPGITGIRVKRFIASLDSSSNPIRVILTDLTQSSGIYINGGILSAYSGSSMMVSNWSREGLGGTNTDWLANYNGHLGTHYVYLLGTAADHYMANGAGISQKKTTLNVVTGGHKYYQFVGGEDGYFAYFDSRGSSAQPCIPVTTRSDMLDTTTSIQIDSTEKVQFVTQTMRYYYNGSAWVETNYTGWFYRVRKYGKQFIEQSFTADNVDDVEGSANSYAPTNLLTDDAITESTVATVAAYTGIAISGTTITLSSGTWTPKKLYDYSKYWLTQNMSVADFCRFENGVYEFDYKIVVQTTFNLLPDSGILGFSASAPIFELDINGGTVETGETTVTAGVTSYYVGGVIKFKRIGTNWNQNHANIRIRANSTLNMYGGTITLGSPIYIDNSTTAVWLTRSGTIQTVDGVSNVFVRSWGTTGLDIQGLKFDNMVFGAFRSPATFKGNELFESRFSAVGTSNSGTNTEFHIEDYSPVANTDTDFFNEGSSVVSLYNVSVGSDLKHKVSDSDPNVAWFVNTGGSKLYKKVNFNILDVAKAAIEDCSIFTRDTNNNERTTITSAGGTSENFTADKTYFFTTDSSGSITTANILTAVFYFTDGASPTEYIVDRRSTQNDNTDSFTFHLWHYNKLYASKSESLKGVGTFTSEITMLDDDVVTESDATTVAAYTGISINHSTDTITLSSGTWTPKKLYDYCKYNKTLQANIEQPTISTMCFSFVEGVYISEYAIVNNTTLTVDEDNGLLAFSSTAPTLALSGSGTFNIGKQTISNGITSYTTGTVIDFRNQGTSWYQNPCYEMNGTVVWNGGSIEIGRPITTNASLTSFTCNKGEWKVKSHAMTSPYELNFNDANFTINDMTINGRGTFLILEDFTINKLTGQLYDGIFPSDEFSGANTDFLNINNYDSVGSYTDFVQWRRSKAKFINSINGSDITVQGKESTSNSNHTGITEFWSDIKIKVTDSQGNPFEDARIIIKDYDHSDRTDTSSLTGSATTGHYNTGFDYTPDRTYSQVTDSNGYTPDIRILFAVVDRSVGGAQATPAGDWSYRGLSADHDDEIDVNVWQYGKNHVNGNVSLKGSGVKTVHYITTNDLNITEADPTVVAAYSGIAINHTTQTITITSNRTLAELYDFVAYDKTTAASAPYPTPSTRVGTIVGSKINIGSYNLVIDGCDVTTGDSGFSLLETTGVITLQNNGTIDFNFLDANGDALVLIDTPQNWNIEGVYASQTDALNQANRLDNTVAYKYLVSAKGGDTVWIRVHDSDSNGMGIDDFLLPSVRGVYETAAITTTEDSLLNQIRALTRDIYADTDAMSNNHLTKSYFDDFQVRTGYSLSEVNTVNMNYTGSTNSHAFIQAAGKVFGNVVDIRGSVLSKLTFYVGQIQDISSGNFTPATIKFKVWEFANSGSNQTPSIGSVLWETDEINISSLTTVSSEDFGVTGKRQIIKQSQEYDVVSDAIKITSVLLIGVEVVSGEVTVEYNTGGGQSFNTYFWSENVLNSTWVDNIPAYVRYGNVNYPSKLKIEKYDYESVDSQRLRAAVDDVKAKTDLISIEDGRVESTDLDDKEIGNEMILP